MKLSSLKRIGPHNQDVISLIIGSILGDTHLEKRKKGLGTRIIFEQSSNNVEYLM
jgi:ubiquinol-cytochrome c reductase cytochrome b subunit